MPRNGRRSSRCSARPWTRALGAFSSASSEQVGDSSFTFRFSGPGTYQCEVLVSVRQPAWTCNPLCDSPACPSEASLPGAGRARATGVYRDSSGRTLAMTQGMSVFSSIQ